VESSGTEESAWDVTKDLVERADSVGRLRAIVDAIRSGLLPVLEGGLRAQAVPEAVRVSFVELHDAAPVRGPDAEIVDSMLWKNMFAVADPRERVHLPARRHCSCERFRDRAVILEPSSPAISVTKIRVLAERLLR
jgi:hypothetical protein